MSDTWLRYLADPHPWQPPNPLPGPIQTGRLVIRAYETADAAPLFEAINEGRQALLPWMAWAHSDHMEVAHTVYYVECQRRMMHKPENNRFNLGIFDRTDNTCMGGTGFHRIDRDQRTAEVGYWIRGDRHGQGLCTEAVGHLISQGFAPPDRGGWGFRRIVVFNASGNTGSRRVCEKLGLRLEMRLRNERYLGPVDSGGPGYHDTNGFAVLSGEWDRERHRAKPCIGWAAGTFG